MLGVIGYLTAYKVIISYEAIRQLKSYCCQSIAGKILCVE